MSFIVGNISTFPVVADPASLTGSLAVSGSTGNPRVDIKGPTSGTALKATGSVDVNGNLTLSGDLTVNGTTTTLSTTNTIVKDQLIELGNGNSGSPSGDAGIIVERGSSANVFFGWDESADTVVLGTTSATGASSGNLTITPTDLNVSDITLTPDGISTSHIISAGSLKVQADANIHIGDNGADSIRIGRINTTAAKIHMRSGADTDLVVSNSKVGIGTDTPDTTLQVLSTATQAKFSYDADSSATITVADASHTTIATGESGNLTLDAAGDIALSADGGNVTMDDGTITIFDFNVDDTSLTIHDDQDTGDTFSITVAQHGSTTIATVDDDATAADLILDVDGDIRLNAAGGDISFRENSEVKLIFDMDQTGAETSIYSGVAGDDIVFKVPSGGTEILRFTDGGQVEIKDNLSLKSNAAVLKFGASEEVTLTHVHNTGLLLSDDSGVGTTKLMFGDSATFIQQQADGQLGVDADSLINITAPTLDIDASTAVTIDGPAVTIADSADGKPVVTIKTTHTTTASSGELQFLKDAADTEDGEVLGQITFFGEDEGNNNTQFAEIVASISESDESDEAGKLELQVANDGTLRNGITIEGNKSAAQQVDVTLGNTATSVVTVPGFISIGGHTINDVDVAGEFVDSDEHLMTAAAINDRFAISGAVDELNELSDVSFGSGDLTITSLDTLTTSATAHNAEGTDLLIQGGNTTAGTTNNIAGGDLTLAAGQGKGSGAGGDIVFRTANAGGSGSSLNALATALTISDDLSSTFTGNATFGVDDTGVDVRIFSATASEGVLYDASEDELGLLLTTKLKFHDIGGGEEIFASANGHLEINSGTTLDMTAPTVDINASTAVTIDSPDITITSSTSAKPVLTLSNTNADANSAELKFNNDSASGADSDVMGKISFYGTDAAENTEQELAFMDAIITDSADGSEAASMRFFVAENDGTRTAGLVIAGQADDDGEVDVTIGAGAASTTTVAGGLTVTTDLTVTGADIVLGGDSDGTDRTVTFGHSTLKTIMGIDDSADAFVINTDAAFDGTLANNSLSIDASHNMIVAGNSTVKGRIICDDTTDATSTTDGSLQTDGGLSVALDAIIGNDVYLLTDSAVLGLGVGKDATLTHDGTTGLTIAATPISIDSTGELHLNSTTGDIKLQDGGTDQIIFDLDGTAGAVIMKPAVNSDDLVFQQFDGTEVIRIEDDASLNLVASKLNISQSSSDVTIAATTSDKDIKFNVLDDTTATTVMTMDGDVSAVIMNKVFAKTITSVTADNADHTEITATTPVVVVDASGTGVQGNATDSFHDLGLVAGTVPGQTLTISLGAGDIPSTCSSGIRVGRAAQRAQAGLTFATIPDTGHTLLLDDAGGSSNRLTVTFSDSVAIASSSRTGAKAITVGIDGLDPSNAAHIEQVAVFTASLINLCLDNNDMGLYANASGTSIFVKNTVGGTNGNTSGGNGAVAGTAVSNSKITAFGGGSPTFSGGAASPSALDTTYHQFGFKLNDPTRDLVGTSSTITFLWDGTKWAHLSGGTALTA